MPNTFVGSFNSVPPSGKVIGHYTQVRNGGKGREREKEKEGERQIERGKEREKMRGRERGRLREK